MVREFDTEQEAFWAGEFGDEYTRRNTDPSSIAHRTALFAEILRRTRKISSILELGANLGFNLLALRTLVPESRLTGVEINPTAAATLRQISGVTVLEGSLLQLSSYEMGLHDLTLSAGVLMLIEPSHLPEAYARLYECSTCYICLVEYYNPTPVEVSYRGHAKRLFKRDFAGDMLDMYADLELIDYGFQYHRDYNFPGGDANWFLLQKKSQHP